MDAHRNRYTGVLVVSVSLVVAIALSALFYYYKIEKNETYQNQLHFRELQRYGTLLTQSVDSLTVGVKSTLTDFELLRAKALWLKVEKEQQQIEVIKKLSKDVNTKYQELASKRDDLASAKKELSQLTEKIKQIHKSKALLKPPPPVASELFTGTNKLLEDKIDATKNEMQSSLKDVVSGPQLFNNKKAEQGRSSEITSMPSLESEKDQDIEKLINELVEIFKFDPEDELFKNWRTQKAKSEELHKDVERMDVEFYSLRRQWNVLYFSVNDSVLEKTTNSGGTSATTLPTPAKITLPKQCFINYLSSDNSNDDENITLCISDYLKVAASLQKIKFSNINLIRPDGDCGKNCNSKIDQHDGKASLFVVEKRAEITNKPYGMIVPLEDFLTASPLVPLVMLTDSSGERLFRAENLALGARHQGLRFENLSEVIKSAAGTGESGASQSVQTQQVQLNTGLIEAAKTADTEGVRGTPLNLFHSRYFDTELAGESYRIFMTPWRHPQINNGAVYYLFAVQARDVLTLNKMAVSGSTVLLLMLLVVVLVAFLPLIKIRLVGYSQTFSRTDTHTLVLGLVMLITALSLALFHFLHYNGIKHQLDITAKAVNRDMQTAFSSELSAWKGLAEKMDNTAEQFVGDRLFSDHPKFKQLGAVQEADKSKQRYSTHSGRYWPEGVARLKYRSANEQLQLRLIQRLQLTLSSQKLSSKEKEKEKEENGKSDASNDKKPSLLDSATTLWKELQQTQQSQLQADPEQLSAPERPFFTGLAFWSSMRQFSPSREFIPLTGRHYVNNAFSCKQLDSVPFAPDCRNNMYIEQVLNKRDLRLNTWIGIPLFDSPSTPNEQREIMIVGGQLLTFTQPVLPRHFQFLVFDNHTGEVLMHSDSRYSKIDNIFVDTDNNGRLKALAYQRQKQAQPLDVIYKGHDYRFAVSRLHDSVPWTLVVMYDKAPFRLLNMSAAFFAFCLTVLAVCVVYILIRVTPHGTKFIAAIIWPSQKRAAFAKRDPNLYIIGLLSVALITISFFSFSAGYYSANYLTNKYNYLNRLYVASRLSEQEATLRNLSDTIYDGIKDDLHLKVPCFGFKIRAGVWSAECDSGSISKLHNSARKNLSVDNSFINFIWQNYSLDMTLLNEVWALAALSWDAVESEVNGKTAQAHNIVSSEFDTFDSPGAVIKNGLSSTLMLILSLACLVVLLLLYLLLRYWVWRRLMGLDQPPNFRINPKAEPSKGYKLYHAIARILSGYKTLHNNCFYVQLIRPAAAMQAVLNGDIASVDQPLLQSAGLAGLTVHKVQQCETAKVVTEYWTEKPTLALSGFETLPLDKKKRVNALAFIQQLKQQGDTNLILVVEVAPLYRLTHPEAYPVALKDEDKPDEAEILAWSELLRDFVKVYDWVPHERMLNKSADAVDTLLYAASSWPELEPVAVEFLIYHFAVKERNLRLKMQGDTVIVVDDNSKLHAVNAEEMQHNFECCAALFTQLQRNEAPAPVIASINQNWRDVNQVIDFFGTAAGAHYRYRWELCTIQERLLMINIANERLPNPRNYIPLDHLVRRGFIFCDRGWHLTNCSFQKFVRTAEDREIVRTWIGEASESIWKYTRFPLLVVLFLLLAGLAYTATEAFQTLFGIFSAVLAAMPLVLRVFTFARGGSLE